MLSKQKRIPRTLFPHVANGGAFHTHLFTVRWKKSSQDGGRFSVVVSKKVAKTAVLRNKLRRRFYSALQNFPVKEVQGVIFVKKEATQASTADIVREIKAFRP